ncbi:MAG: DNA cytosine methyltransferase [Verrucomicrobia bacterium]|nr:DNA cytosine methyltransferase [Verrucomicrobiota bacterium]
MISTTEQAINGTNRPSNRSEQSLAVQCTPPTAPGAVDLCCGLGGLSLAAKKLGVQIVAGVDVNSSALKTFSKNFPATKALEGSVRSKTILAECAKLLEPFKAANQPTIILSGPPCQGFSAAGSRDPADPRNQVLVAVARAVSKLQPDCALIENVSMLLADKHSDRIRKFEQIIQQGEFHITHIVLDASEFGVSQKRRRAFFLVTKQPIDEHVVLERLEEFKTDPVGARETLNGLSDPKVRPDDYDDDKDYGGVANHFAMRHSERVMKKIAAIDPGTGPMSYRRLHPTRLSNTLFSGHRAPPAHFKEPRSITVREAARLQGFPDSFRVYGSFANQMEQVTNAVPPPLAKAVLSVLAELADIPVCLHG